MFLSDFSPLEGFIFLKKKGLHKNTKLFQKSSDPAAITTEPAFSTRTRYDVEIIPTVTPYVTLGRAAAVVIGGRGAGGRSTSTAT